MEKKSERKDSNIWADEEVDILLDVFLSLSWFHVASKKIQLIISFLKASATDKVKSNIVRHHFALRVLRVHWSTN